MFVFLLFFFRIIFLDFLTGFVWKYMSPSKIVVVQLFDCVKLLRSLQILRSSGHFLAAKKRKSCSQSAWRTLPRQICIPLLLQNVPLSYSRPFRASPFPVKSADGSLIAVARSAFIVVDRPPRRSAMSAEVTAVPPSACAPTPGGFPVRSHSIGY